MLRALQTAGFVLRCAAAFLFAVSSGIVVLGDDPIDFDRDVRGILSDNCFQCHGPDAEKREGELRLDRREDFSAPRDDGPLVVPEDAASSLLYRRIAATDETQMPPADSDNALTDAEKETVRRWIEQGAEWQQHWAFVPPRRPKLPQVVDENWCGNEIDRFVLARLEREELAPATSTDKARLLRRVTLDLTGAPPTVAEIDAFIADDSVMAYERVVDRSLNSPRFGERMAMRWLDLARYADTSGYQNDGPRQMWRWRDWVIDAYNANMPFDQFTIEQLAGDMLQQNRGLYRGEWHGLDLNKQDRDRLIATAFNRNHRGNAEGGIVPEEYQVEYVVDRVDTTATVWLGLTLGCARCHDHKYDPVTQKEFYQVFSFFNKLPEYGRAVKEGNSPPYMLAPTDEQTKQLAEVRRRKKEYAANEQLEPNTIDKALAAWTQQLAAGNEQIAWTITDGLVARYQLDGDLTDAQADAKLAKAEGGTMEFADRGAGKALELNGETFVNAGDVANFGYFDPCSISVWVYPRGDGTLVSRMAQETHGAGYYLHLEDRRLQFNMVKRWLDDSIRVETTSQLTLNHWQHVTMTYDGSRVASGIRIFVDGVQQPTTANHDFLNQTMASEEPLRIGAGHSAFNGLVDDVQIYNRALKLFEVAVVSTDERIEQIARMNAEDRTPRQTTKLRRYFLTEAAPEAIRTSQQRLDNVIHEEATLIASLPTLMIMQDAADARKTFVLSRGQYDQPRGEVSPGVPSLFGDARVENRLQFARWLVSGENTLTGRVAVNRFWEMLFGEGLVRSMEDFGSQGERPTHTELLDWLAVEFAESGWDVKHMLKTMVMSATYRQASTADKAVVERDPENRLLARQSRFRMSAELIRDQALAASGLLHERLGGPSVMPYQPDGLWNEIATDTNYEQSDAPDLYRRSLYTYWKRTVAPPTMTTFDAPAREMCAVRRPRTNTPLQALAILNDATYVEAARALGQRAMDFDEDRAKRLQYVFRSVLARSPTTEEMTLLDRALSRYQAAFHGDDTKAKKLLSVGEQPLDEGVDVVELAAYTLTASIVFNTDEAVTRE